MIKLKKIIFVVISFFVFNINYAQNKTDKLNLIVIDAGHGGKDPGALGKQSKEKDIALAIALKLGKLIETNLTDVKVIYTRTNDKFIELHKRSEIANKNNADLFISIHVDANKATQVTGTSTFVMGLNKADKQLEVVKRENAVILIEDDYKVKYDGFDPNSPESDIIFSLYQNAYLEQSIIIAEEVQNQFKESQRTDRDVRQAGLVVLWNCSMPSILIETGFITNQEEEKYLLTENGQNTIASSIFKAIKLYKNTLEGNSEDNIKDNVIFKIQIAYTGKKIDTIPDNFNGISNVECFEDGHYYRYFTGNAKTYDEIAELQEEIRKKVPESYVIAFNNGKIITIKEALKILNN
jgi:N-acetylmuramoyl-L-alanine amidase